MYSSLSKVERSSSKYLIIKLNLEVLLIVVFFKCLIKVLYACRLAFRTLVRKYSCDLCYTPMIVAADFVRSIKARDSEFTTNQGM